MQNYSPDYTIHLGDIYFVGMKEETTDNFISENCSWPKGSSGSFSLLGNHEMYSRGISFFRDLLPTLGIRSNKEKNIWDKKPASFVLKMNIGE